MKAGHVLPPIASSKTKLDYTFSCTLRMANLRTNKSDYLLLILKEMIFIAFVNI